MGGDGDGDAAAAGVRWREYSGWEGSGGAWAVVLNDADGVEKEFLIFLHGRFTLIFHCDLICRPSPLLPFLFISLFRLKEFIKQNISHQSENQNYTHIFILHHYF